MLPITPPPNRVPKRRDGRVIIHFDYDCFYASVVEAENPALKTIPLAIQQKQIIVTCNYEARRRGLFKLQLIREAKRVCPDVVIVLGEDLTRFRDASKDLYSLIRSFSWNDRVERLGFDEVWMDITDMVDYNTSMLNENNMETSFFQLSRDDPSRGFTFNALKYAGHAYPARPAESGEIPAEQEALALRLRLGSHLAMHIRHVLEEQKGYTSTVGIATSKLLSKLVGNKNKPRGQTSLIPPYEAVEPEQSNVITFMDSHDIGAVPGIGFKLAQKIRERCLGRTAKYEFGLVYGGTLESVTVGDVRQRQDLTPEALEKLLKGPGSPQGIGAKIYSLLRGVDDSQVIEARDVPRQISIEDSYIRLDTMQEVIKEMTSASRSLVQRMRVDLTEPEPAADERAEASTLRWIGRPETLRLSTRPRPPLNDDGTRTRTFKRISRSTALPSFVFSLDEHLDSIADRLVHEALVPMFRRLHPERSGWNLSLLNVAVTNMVDVGTGSKASAGRDIHSMFSKQEENLRPFRVQGESDAGAEAAATPPRSNPAWVAENSDEAWEPGSDDDDMDEGDDYDRDADVFSCPACHASIPVFARAAHQRFHAGQ